jgi:hypothetical protein
MAQTLNLGDRVLTKHMGKFWEENKNYWFRTSISLFDGYE